MFIVAVVMRVTDKTHWRASNAEYLVVDFRSLRYFDHHVHADFPSKHYFPTAYFILDFGRS